MAKFQTAYRRYRRYISNCSGVSLTQQHFKDQTDIQLLIARHKVADQIPYVMDQPPVYGDFTSGDFTYVMQLINAATADFNDLPSELRERFGNDPVRFMDFVSDPKNVPEMRSLGLLRPDYETKDELEKRLDAEALDKAKRAKRAEVQLNLPD